MKNIFCLLLFATLLSCRSKEVMTEKVQTDTVLMQEKHRPQLHFSPPSKWMNDPNGLVFHNNEYHLFYQYYPEAMVWGPMHWGHAVSKDLVQWEHLPIALYPDSLGLIFSGSAVVDKNNTSGFGSKENPALVAIFTYHHMEKEKQGATDYQNQGIAYSTDNGRTWTKYEGNPVLKNQGIKDFRDPKVFWHEPTQKWVMSLAVKDHIEFWSSNDFKSWSKLSDFGIDYGAHGGVWECPDLFELRTEKGESKWILLVSINPGGPNGGSATQYFVGNFDGKTFTTEYPKAKTTWLDYGPDNYAGVTWSNVPDDRKIFIGWMSNWAYGQEVPTDPWRSAMTAPRELSLKKEGNDWLVRSALAKEFTTFGQTIKDVASMEVTDSLALTGADMDVSKSIISATFEQRDFYFSLDNAVGQQVRVGYDASNNEFYIDRSRSGNTAFSSNYVLKATAPRSSSAKDIKVTMVVDVSSVEVFFDDGVTLMAALFFPDSVLSQSAIVVKQPMQVKDIEVKRMSGIWKQAGGS